MFIEGTASQNVYSVDYPQLQWNKLKPEQIAEYTPRWAKLAQEAQCKYLVVRSIPDALFGEGGPLVVHQETFDNRPWSMTVNVEVKLHSDTVFNRVRDAMLTRLRIAYGPATGYRIYQTIDDTITLLEEGVI